MNPMAAQGVLIAYGLLLAAGGALGYLKAKSRPSLISGMVSGILAIVFAVVTGVNPRVGCVLGAFLAVLLASFFAVRFRKSRKWMPAGMMMIVSQAATIFLLIAAGTVHAT